MESGVYSPPSSVTFKRQFFVKEVEYSWRQQKRLVRKFIMPLSHWSGDL